MYWKNKTHHVKLNQSDFDPIQDHVSRGIHLLYWHPALPFRQILSLDQTLQHYIDHCNEWLEYDGIDNYYNDPRNHHEMTNLMQTHVWVKDLQQQGNVKPWLIHALADGRLRAGTGSSRQRALDLLPQIVTVPAFVTVHRDLAESITDLKPVTDLKQFAELCKATADQEFWFRFTDDHAPYGVDWYEYDSALTRGRTIPAQSAALAMYRFLTAHPGFRMSREWFLTPVDWDQFLPS